MKPKTLLLKFLLAGILLGSQHFADCATFYVSPSGSDSAVGSQSAPWKRLQKGLAAAQPGDTIRLLPGIHYPGGESFTGRDGTAALPITILGQPDNTAVIAGGGTQGQDVLRIRHAYYVVKNLKWDGYRIQLLGPNSHHNIVEANTITNAFYGVEIYGSTDPTHKNGPNNNIVRNNVVTHWKSDGGIKVAGHDNLISSNRLEFNDGWDAMRAFGYGHRIQDNLFKGIKSDPGGNHVDIIQSFGTNGSVAYDIIFERNTLIDCSDSWPISKRTVWQINATGCFETT
ncbi:MAG: right-handed parallel beta-helix repeat-containing protein [Nitrospirales bacterium]|nr:right-handed parallel beta-helix repeat-containing protein [Nitrospirales bacterium]